VRAPQTQKAEDPLARARALSAAGRTDDAKTAYLEILKQAPSDPLALSELAVLAYESNNRSAARTLYKQMVLRHPKSPTGWINLGTILLEDGELTAAQSALEAALAIEPNSPGANRSLAQLFTARGKTARAERHWRSSFAGQAIVEQRYLGPEPATEVLVLVSIKGGNIPMRPIFDSRSYKTTVLYVEYYVPALPLPPHALIFNAIGDADLCQDALVIAGRIVATSRAPLINPPKRVLKTGRLANATRLGRLAGVQAPSMRIMRKEKASELTFPVLLRTPGFHTGQHFLKVEQAADAAAALAELPGEEVLAIEYLDARGEDGCVRKYRVMLIGGQIYPLHLAISSDWKVHYFTADMALSEDHRREEGLFLDHMEAHLGPKAVAALKRIAQLLDLDYGGIDFALAADGTVLLFEANATMVIVPPPMDHKWDYRRPAIDRALEAAKALLRAKIQIPHPATRGPSGQG
jgi:hypothetical protein